MKKIKNLINADVRLKGITEKELLEHIEDGSLTDRVFQGISNKGFESFSPRTDPSLYVWGAMGGGKTFCTGSDMLITKLANFERMMMVVVDVSNKEGNDWNFLFKIEDSVIRATGNEDFSRVFIVLSLLKKELDERAKEFSKIGGAGDFQDYERLYHGKVTRYLHILDNIKKGKKLGKLNRKEYVSFLTGDEKNKSHSVVIENIKNYFEYEDEKFTNLTDKYLLGKLDDTEYLKFLAENGLLRISKDFDAEIMKLANGESYDMSKLDQVKDFHGVARIMVIFEEWHKVILSEFLDFYEERNTSGTLANILVNLMKTSRSFGLCFTFISQKADQREFNSDLEAGVKNLKSFKGQSWGRTLKGDPEKISKFGQFFTENYEGRSITLSDSAKSQLIDRYHKPLKGELFSFQFDEWNEILREKGTVGVLKHFDVGTLIGGFKAFEAFELRFLLERVLVEYGFSIEHTELNPNKDVSMIVSRGDERYGVVYKVNKKHYRGDMSKEEMTLIKIDLKESDVEKVIYFQFGNGESNSFDISLDFNQLSKIGEIISSRESLGEDLYQKKLGAFPLSASIEPKEKASRSPRGGKGSLFDKYNLDDD